MSEKILSIIIPSYNMEMYLPKCLNSLILEDKKLLHALDVIVVNDGSKDQTSKIAHDFENQYPGVFRVIDKENGHYGSCINAALSVAQGVYVKVLDADDWFDTKEFQCFLDEITKHVNTGNKPYDLVISLFDKVDSTGQILARNRWEWNESYTTDFAGLKEKFGKIYLYHVTYCLENLKRMEYRQTEGILYTDMEWITIPMSTVRRVCFTPYVVYKYLIGREGQSINQNVRIANVDAYVKILLGYSNFYVRNIGSWNLITHEYMHIQLMQMASLAYGLPVYDLPIRDAKVKIKKIKSELDTISVSLREDIESSLLIIGKKSRFSVFGICNIMGFDVGLRIARAYRQVSRLFHGLKH